MVEISIVGFLIGTLIAFMVVIGDLGPEILSEIFSVENNSSLRTIIMTGTLFIKNEFDHFCTKMELSFHLTF